MKKRLAVIVSVSPSEPEEVVIASAQYLKKLDFDNLDFKIVYIIDRNGIDDDRPKKLREMDVDVFERDHRRGRKAGAINDCLSHLIESGFRPDYIAFLDVDSRPSENFIVKCVEALESDERAFIASSERRVINPESFVSETLDVEYGIFNYFLRRADFRNFNGLIGVVRGKALIEHRMDEKSFAEDLEFSVRMHALGFRSLFVEGAHVYEQAPVSWRDLFIQRRRWYYGGLQLFKNRYLRKNKRFGAEILLTVVIAHLIIFFIPFLIFSPFFILYRFRKVKKLRLVLGLAIYLLVNQIAAISSLYSFLRGREIEWQGIKRVER